LTRESSTYPFEDVGTVLLGLQTGAMLLIGYALAPWSPSLDPAEFLRSFAVLSRPMTRLVMPLGSLTAVMMFAAVAQAGVNRLSRWPLLGFAAACAAFVSALDFLYFIDANAALASNTIPPEEISASLRRWRAWHWARVGVGALGFVVALNAARRR
jgi:hypothetical protein